VRDECLPDDVTKQGEPKRLGSCTLPLTGSRVLSRVITDLAVLYVAGTAFHLVELAPGVTLAEVAAKTGHRKGRECRLLTGSSVLTQTTGILAAMTDTAAPNRLDRRKARTRAALVAAARELLASRDPAEVSIQEITDTADVGFGSFYNHFESKADLFDAAMEEVLEEHGALFDALTADMDDPAEVYASSVRMTVRMATTHPQIAKIIQRAGLRYLNAPDGLAPRALRDLKRARDAGRFQIGDPAVGLACSGGAVLGVLALSTTNPNPKAIAAAADELAVNLLRMFGLPDDEAREIARRPLPKP
jgi:AcrR family transcriptional regulator